MDTADSFDRAYRASQRFFMHPRFLAGMTIAWGLLALAITLGTILQPVSVSTRLIGIITAAVLWLSTAAFFNFWRKWKVVYVWNASFQRKAERVDAYFTKVDAGELPDGPTPPEIRQDLRDILRQELIRQEWRD